MRDWIVIGILMLVVLWASTWIESPTHPGCACRWRRREGFLTNRDPQTTTTTADEPPDPTALHCVVVRQGEPRVCVRSSRTRNLPEAAQLLYDNRRRVEQLNAFLRDRYPHLPEVQLYLSRVKPEAIEENLPTSEFTAVTTNKGDKIQFTLSPESKQDLNTLIHPHTLFFVTLHELAHVMDALPDHSEHFWKCFGFLLKVAKEAGLHDPVDYSIHPTKYSGDMIRSNPYFTYDGSIELGQKAVPRTV